MKSVEIFLNFMVMDMNMNVLWKNPSAVSSTQIERMIGFGAMIPGAKRPIVKKPDYSAPTKKKRATKMLRTRIESG